MDKSTESTEKQWKTSYKRYSTVITIDFEVVFVHKEMFL